QLQRVAICRALINKPSIIFGDEPTGALNSSFAQEVMDVLGEINRKGTTILLATHDINVAARTERILYMNDGKIVGDFYLGKYNNEMMEYTRKVKKLRDKNQNVTRKEFITTGNKLKTVGAI